MVLETGNEQMKPATHIDGEPPVAADEQAIEPPDDLGGTLLEQMFQIWVEPEIARRGLEIDRSEVLKALVVMAPNQLPVTLLNKEVVLVGKFRATREIAEGEEVTEDDVEDLTELRPVDIDPDAGWICFAQFKGCTHIAFDFRRNQSRSAELLARASEFLATARLALSNGFTSPAIDNAYAAAELVTCAQMYLIEDSPTRDHVERRRWFKDWTSLGNAPIEYSQALTTLAKHRGAARYAEKTVKLKPKHLEQLLATVEEAIAHAVAGIDGERTSINLVAAEDIKKGQILGPLSSS
jgi:HEPN domain-containing protein